MTIPNSEAALPRQPGSFGFAAGVFLASLLWLWLCGRVLDYVADDALIRQRGGFHRQQQQLSRPAAALESSRQR